MQNKKGYWWKIFNDRSFYNRLFASKEKKRKEACFW